RKLSGSSIWTERRDAIIRIIMVFFHFAVAQDVPAPNPSSHEKTGDEEKESVAIGESTQLGHTRRRYRRRMYHCGGPRWRRIAYACGCFPSNGDRSGHSQAVVLRVQRRVATAWTFGQAK